MFDKNNFKRTVKDWLKNNHDATIQDLEEYCEQLIPGSAYPSNSWLIDQTVHWYRHLLSNRELTPEEQFEVDPAS